MSIVKCVKCSERYDTGTNLEHIDLSFYAYCPACGQWMLLPLREAVAAPSLSKRQLKQMMAQSRLIETPSWKFW